MDWHARNALTPERRELALRILADIQAGKPVNRSVRRHPQADGGLLPKTVLIAVYREQVEAGALADTPQLLESLRMKPVRTLSGVSTITILTKPFPCPGECIFCPDDARMPKSYLADEPGAMRGLQNQFDPYLQVTSRLQALHATAHPVDKIELLILGGTWSAYPRSYQEEFVLRVLEALNGAPSTTLEEAQQRNETAPHRLVGLVIETRPDAVSPREVAWLRRLGVTKVQIGVQSLDDGILELNRRGHTVAEAARACALLRAAGFKLVLHWMPNLLGATPQSDREDFARLFSGAFMPDELKIYPCQLLEGTQLYQIWKSGDYSPYSTETLSDLLADLKVTIPPWCRVNRIIRDIPSTHVVAGNRRTSLRDDVLRLMGQRGWVCRCVRCREVRGEAVDAASLRLEALPYQAGHAAEIFLQFVTANDRLAGYLRLSLPSSAAPDLSDLLPDLAGCALVREVHVYGQSLAVGEEGRGAAQHSGLGRRLLARAEEIARERGYQRMAVIASVGTREYYRRRGYRLAQTYMVKDLGVTPGTVSAD